MNLEKQLLLWRHVQKLCISFLRTNCVPWNNCWHADLGSSRQKLIPRKWIVLLIFQSHETSCTSIQRSRQGLSSKIYYCLTSTIFLFVKQLWYLTQYNVTVEHKRTHNNGNKAWWCWLMLSLPVLNHNCEASVQTQELCSNC